MKIEEYLVEGETISSQIGAYANPDAMSESSKGTLACTPYRLVYVNGSEVTDISLKGVNSIEYSEPSYPSRYLSWGILGIAGGLVILAIGLILASETFVPETGVWLVAGLIGVGGILTLIQGYFLMRATLNVNTPNKTYTFNTDEDGLAKIGHTVRGYEMKIQ